MRGGLTRLGLLIAVTQAAAIALAADPPDAGQILRQQERREAPSGGSPFGGGSPFKSGSPFGGDSAPDKPVTEPSSATRRVSVKAFRLQGLTVAPESDVQAVLKPYRGRESTITQLHEAATAVQDYLRRTGYLVRVYVPTQDVRDGTVELDIVEGRLGDIEIKRAEGLRVSDAAIRGFFAASGLKTGDLIRPDYIENGALLVNDLAGVRARALLAPGKDPGASTLIVNALAEPFLQGGVVLDNTGSKYTGRERVDGDLRINSPFGYGDYATLRASNTRYSGYARVAYSAPVTASGLTLGAAYSHNTYQLCCEFAALQQGGWATALNLFAAQPLVRTMAKSVWVSLVYADKRIYSRLPGAIVSDHSGTSWAPGLNGDWQDHWGGSPARTNWNVQATLGRMDYGRSPDLAGDAATALAQGNYKKISASVSRLQKLGEAWTLSVAVRTQYAAKNLHSSEKFILGGSSGVRAYPTGEGVGDEGMMVNIELQRELAENWTVGALLDHGEVKLHRLPWSGWEGGNPSAKNRYGLSGAGLSLGWQPSAQVSVRAILAAPLRRNPGLDPFGRNSEGGKDGGRLWATLSWSF